LFSALDVKSFSSCVTSSKEPRNVEKNSSFDFFKIFCFYLSDSCLKQLNGKFGCIGCLNSGKMIGITRIYVYKRSVQLRSNLLYSIQAKKAQVSKLPFEGIKGQNFLSQFCSFPDSILIDTMHLFGVVKHFLSLWFNPKNSSEEYYLGWLVFSNCLNLFFNF